MALSHSPKIVTDGLVFYYDMENTQKSWKGKPTVNMYADGDYSSGALHPVRSGNWSIIPDERNTAKKVLKVTPSTSTQYHGRDIAAVVGTVYSISVDVFASSDCNLTSFAMHGEQGASGTDTYYNFSNKGTWQRLVFNNKSATTTNMRILMYALASFTTGYMLVSNLQVEQNSFATPFVNGTRTNTQSLIDLTGKNTITCNELTYNSNGSFSFDGSNDYLTSNGNLGNLSAYTISFWSKRNVESTMPVASFSGSNFYWYGDNSWRYVHGGTGGEYYYPHAVSIPLNTWGFYTVVYNGSNVSIYRQGVLEGSQATSGSADWTTGIRFGAYSSGSLWYNGELPVVKFYNRALSALEVKQNFNALRSRYGI